jgi:hypothetical protein
MIRHSELDRLEESIVNTFHAVNLSGRRQKQEEFRKTNRDHRYLAREWNPSLPKIKADASSFSRSDGLRNLNLEFSLTSPET